MSYMTMCLSMFHTYKLQLLFALKFIRHDMRSSDSYLMCNVIQLKSNISMKLIILQIILPKLDFQYIKSNQICTYIQQKYTYIAESLSGFWITIVYDNLCPCQSIATVLNIYKSQRLSQFEQVRRMCKPNDVST